MNKEKWPKLVTETQSGAGFLIDTEIKLAIDNNQLIQNGDPEQAKYASYELRIGTKVQQLAMDDSANPNRDIYTAKQIPENGTFTIQPGETFKIYAVETLSMPADVLALTVPVGNMYKLGLNPETTFADPGFSGEFYVTVCNYSPRIVRLKIGDPLSRIFFIKLRERPERIHESPPRETPPSVERVPRPTDVDLATMGDAMLLTKVLSKVDPPHYEHAFVTNRLIGIQRLAVEESINRVRGQLRIMRQMFIGVGTVVVVMVVVALYRACAGRWPTMTEGTASSLIATAVWLVAVNIIQRVKKWD